MLLAPHWLRTNQKSHFRAVCLLPHFFPVSGEKEEEERNPLSVRICHDEFWLWESWQHDWKCHEGVSRKVELRREALLWTRAAAFCVLDKREEVTQVLSFIPVSWLWTQYELPPHTALYACLVMMDCRVTLWAKPNYPISCFCHILCYSDKKSRYSRETTQCVKHTSNPGLSPSSGTCQRSSLGSIAGHVQAKFETSHHNLLTFFEILTLNFCRRREELF